MTTLTTTQKAASIRNAIKSAVKSGQLPAGKYNVRTKYASMMCEITVTVADLDFCAYEIADCANNFGDRAVTMTLRALEVEQAILEMVRAAGFRHDGRHSFLWVNIEHEERSALFSFTNAERNGDIKRAEAA